MNTVVGVKCGSRDLSLGGDFLGESRRRARRRTAATRARGPRGGRRNKSENKQCRGCVSGRAARSLSSIDLVDEPGGGIRESRAKFSPVASRAPSTSHGMSVANGRMRVNVILSAIRFCDKLINLPALFYLVD